MAPHDVVSDKLILGLGNPGERYRETRHNLGFRVVEELARRGEVREWRFECNALVSVTNRFRLAKPQTYMNRSGYAARCLVERHALDVRGILVVYDDVELELGRLRLRPRGGPGGHRGMESVIHSLRSDQIPRLRLGISGAGTDVELVGYVLAEFDADEHETVDMMVHSAADAVEHWLAEGIESAMNEYNG